MKTHELIKNHKGLIFFYPFSGTDFKIITELKKIATVFNKKALFVYCSFGGKNLRIRNEAFS
jgi:lauroyl/myristoyl acyltransferase